MKPPVATRPDGALTGITILVTRAETDGASLRVQLSNLSATVIELPVLAIEPPEDIGPLDSALADLDAFDWIAFTSRHAVHAVFDRLRTVNRSVSVSARIAAVGPSTALQLDTLGVAVTCRPEEATASQLAEVMIRAGVAGSRILLPVGDRARPELRDRLRRAGARVEEVLAYRTVQPLEVRQAGLDALRRGEIDLVTLTSPSSLHNLVAMLGSDRHVLRYPRLVCIGPTTAAAVHEYGLEVAAVAVEHTITGLVAEVVRLVTGRNAT